MAALSLISYWNGLTHKTLKKHTHTQSLCLYVIRKHCNCLFRPEWCTVGVFNHTTHNVSECVTRCFVFRKLGLCGASATLRVSPPGRKEQK